MKCDISKKLSNTLKIESLPLWVLGNPRTMFIMISSQGLQEIGKGFDKLTF